MKKLIWILSCLLIFCSCSAKAYESYGTEAGFAAEKNYYVSRVEMPAIITDSQDDQTELNGIWVSQFDMHPIYRDGGRQRAEKDYRELIEKMMDNLVRDGFNTVFLQLRPNGDSMYESAFYPTSKYIAGVYGGEIQYDAVEIYMEIAKEAGISVHAWINPYRLCSEEELRRYGKGVLFEWLEEGIGKRIELGTDGILYLDPYYEEATELIVNGAKEILERYDFNGIHIDDYFYPTGFEFEDEAEFLLSGYSDKGSFRRANSDRTVNALYEAVHEYEDKIFGVSPAGNIYSLSKKWYVDIYKWLEEDGFVDYIMPQLYFGFENAVCPFDKVLSDWMDALKNDDIRIYIGLSAAKCALGSEGKEDVYAGENGKYEWRDNKDILARSLNSINESGADGFCVFTYSSFYEPLTGDGNVLTKEERTAFCEIVLSD